MCNRISTTERYVYLRVSIPRERYESLVRAFGLRESQALRHLRLRWERVCAPPSPLEPEAESAASGLDRIL